jgi:hypothetical protein
MLTDSPEEFIAGRIGDGLDVEVGEFADGAAEELLGDNERGLLLVF